MKPFYTADIETDPFKFNRRVQPFASGVFDGTVSQVWWGGDAIAQLLEFFRKREGLVYFHNGGKFDLHHLLPHMTVRDLDPRPVMINARIVSLKWRGIEFRDSFALVPKPLRSWVKDDIKIEKLEAHCRERHKEEILRYLRGDVKYLHEMLAAMFERYCPTSIPLTLASLTFKIMERDFGVKIVHTSRSFDRRMRLWYFGGRVQFWKLGRQVGNFRILDINSAFPRAMLEEHWWGEEHEESKSRKVNGECFYKISCTAANGCFPRRSKDGIDFPIGSGDFYVSGWELAAAMEGQAGTRAEGVKILYRLKPSGTVNFAAYVKHFYQLKLEAPNKADRYFAKLILNSFYGKLAQNSENFRETIIRPYRRWPRGKGWELVSDHKDSGRSIFQRPAPSFSRPYCVATGASITGWVRAQLAAVISRNPGVLYTDTDSLIAPSPVIGATCGEGLGDWKEEARCDVVWIAGKKLYCAHNADAPWLQRKPQRTGWIHCAGLGWTPVSREAWGKWSGDPDTPEPWKTASKGVRLPVADIIAVAEGEARIYEQQAPSYGLGRDPIFIVRRIRRADQRGKKLAVKSAAPHQTSSGNSAGVKPKGARANGKR